jgi:hypothetical protein
LRKPGKKDVLIFKAGAVLRPFFIYGSLKKCCIEILKVCNKGINKILADKKCLLADERSQAAVL